jgi:hypothetical protein
MRGIRISFVLCFCFVFLRLVYCKLTVSMDCQLLSALSVFANFNFHVQGA